MVIVSSTDSRWRSDLDGLAALWHTTTGLESDFFLAVQGVCRNHWTDVNYACHDLGLYEAIWACSMIGVVYFLDKKARFQDFTWR